MTMTDSARGTSSYRSRDFSGAGTAVLDQHDSTTSTRPRRATGTSRGTTAQAGRKVAYRRAPAVETPRRKAFQRKAGSQQVFSYRGRRVERPQVDQRLVRFVVSMTLLLVGAVLACMALSGLATSQTFTLQQLQNKERVLANQVETLNRDLQNVSSSAALASKAQELGMVLPDQAGILATDAQGNTVEQRPATDLTRPIVDVNGDTAVAGASSNPEDTNEVADNLNAVPLPYSPNIAAMPYANSDSSASSTTERTASGAQQPAAGQADQAEQADEAQADEQTAAQ